MVYSNDDLLTALRRAAPSWEPKMYTPSEDEQEFGVGAEPLVRLSLQERQVVALCRVLEDGTLVLCDAFEAATPEKRLQVREEARAGDAPSISSVVAKLNAAPKGLASQD